MGKTRQQDRSRHNAWRRHPRIAGFELALHPIEYIGFQYGWCIAVDEIAVRFLAPRAVLNVVKSSTTCVDGVCQDVVDLSHTPTEAAARSIPLGIQPSRQCLDAHGAGRVMTFEKEPEHQPYDFGFNGIDHQLLFDSLATHLGLPVWYPSGGREPFQKPCRAFSFMARMTCLAFSFD
jgi:hypothetical protein